MTIDDKIEEEYDVSKECDLKSIIPEVEEHKKKLSQEQLGEFNSLESKLKPLTINNPDHAHPGNSEALRKMGNIFYENEISNDIASQYYHLAFEEYSSDARILCNLGIIAKEKNDYEKAKEYLWKSLNWNKSLWLAHDALTDILSDENDTTGMVTWINKFINSVGGKGSIIQLAGMVEDSDYEEDNILYQSYDALEVLVSADYGERFDGYDVCKLILSGINPQLASQYNGRFGALDIVNLHKADCSPEKANTYDVRFGGLDIAHLKMARVKNEEAIIYPEHFDGSCISALVHENISPEVAGSYGEPLMPTYLNKGYSGTSITCFVKYGLNDKDVKDYGELPSSVICLLVENGISAEQYRPYGEKFVDTEKWHKVDWKSLIKLINRAKNYEEIAEYDSSLGLDDIIQLNYNSISSSLANQYHGFNGSQISRLVEYKIEPEKIPEYSERFDKEDISWLASFNVSSEFAEKFDPRFKGNDIINLKDVYSPEITQYNAKIPAIIIRALIKNNVSPEKAEEYLKHWNEWELIGVFDVPFDIARKYKENNGLHIGKMYRSGIMPEEANKFDDRFRSDGIVDCIEAKVSPEIANSYHGRFDEYGVRQLVEFNCDPKIANTYDERLNAEAILLLSSVGIFPGIFSENSEIYYSLLKDITHFEEDDTDDDQDSNLLGVGSQGIVILKNESAWKFSQDIDYEYSLLKMLENPKNVIGIKNKPKKRVALELEYVSGDSLKTIMGKKLLSLDKTYHYSLEIFNGLQELRQAGIYQHRDIRPANIMVDEEKERAIIIDLGIATTDPLDPPKDNRRYGGPNDLVSLGQVMYKMATGEHIFAESESMERTIYADELKDHRDWIYGGDERLDPYLRIVNETVTDDKVADLIKLCLTAKGTEEDYQRLEERFAT